MAQDLQFAFRVFAKERATVAFAAILVPVRRATRIDLTAIVKQGCAWKADS
jgi:hypothetical protein